MAALFTEELMTSAAQPAVSAAQTHETIKLLARTEHVSPSLTQELLLLFQDGYVFFSVSWFVCL